MTTDFAVARNTFQALIDTNKQALQTADEERAARCLIVQALEGLRDKGTTRMESMGQYSYSNGLLIPAPIIVDTIIRLGFVADVVDGKIVITLV